MGVALSPRFCYPRGMRRMIACMRETWWLWLVFFGGCTAMTICLDRVFVITYPVCIFTFVYFAMMRFDDQGNKVE